MELLFAIGGGIAVAGYLVWRHLFSEQARARRALRKAGRVAIRAAPDGELAKIVGTVKLLEEHPPILAPLTRRPCAYFEVRVEQKKSTGKTSDWHTVIFESDFHPSFIIEDPSGGAALVELATPQVVLTMDAHFESGFMNDANPLLEEFLRSHSEKSQGWVFNKVMRYREGVLEEGELVAVLGLCRWEPDPNPRSGGQGYRDHSLRLRIEAPAGEAMLISDDPATLGLGEKT